jgi:hypothetical protein
MCIMFLLFIFRYIKKLESIELELVRVAREIQVHQWTDIKEMKAIQVDQWTDIKEMKAQISEKHNK